MLELVLEIDEICKKHNIIYYLAGGSVLGAVRHKGFIPWDDDIDIMMTRQSFIDFERACREDMADDREIITMMNTLCHTKVTIKYMNKSTSQFFRSQVLDYTGCGISLDIMILDPLAADSKAAEQHIAEYVVYNELLTPFFMVNENLYKYVDLYNMYSCKAASSGREKVMNYLYKRLFEDEPAQSDKYLYRWGQQLLIYDRSLFGEPTYMQFEGHMLPVPSKTLDFLRATYGDGWKYLPPQSEQETHVSNVNGTVAYCNMIDDIAQFIDREKALSVFTTRKKYNVKKCLAAHNTNVSIAQQRAIHLQAEIENMPEYAFAALSELSDSELFERMNSYYSFQLDKVCVKNNIFVNIPDRTLALLSQPLVRSGEYLNAEKILNIRKTLKKELSVELKEISCVIDQIRKFNRFFENIQFSPDGQSVDQVAEELITYVKKYPKHIDFARDVLQLYLLSDKYSGDERRSAVESALTRFSDDPEICYWCGRLYLLLENDEKASKLFEKASETNNGLILQGLASINK